MSSEFRRLEAWLIEDDRRSFEWKIKEEGSAKRYVLRVRYDEESLATGEGLTFESGLQHLLGRLAWQGHLA